MAMSQRGIRVNFERMWREMDELLGDPFANQSGRVARAQTGFSPRVDVYYGGQPPRAVVKVELAGVDVDTVALEVAGRDLVITGHRPVAETEGRVYQQLEIDFGPFRRTIPLGADVVADQAKATYRDGILRIELPLVVQKPRARSVPIEVGRPDADLESPEAGPDAPPR